LERSRGLGLSEEYGGLVRVLCTGWAKIGRMDNTQEIPYNAQRNPDKPGEFMSWYCPDFYSSLSLLPRWKEIMSIPDPKYTLFDLNSPRVVTLCVKWNGYGVGHTFPIGP